MSTVTVKRFFPSLIEDKRTWLLGETFNFSLISYKVDEHEGGVDVVQTESKGTATSASLYRMQNIMDAQETDQVSFPISIGVEFWFCLRGLIHT